MASPRLGNPPSYHETYPFATSEKDRAVYSRTSDVTVHGSNTSLSASSDPRAADIQYWSGSLDRMHDARYERQRYVMSGMKSEEVSKLALGAKVERALARRMVGQDASFRTKPPTNPTTDREKRSATTKAQ